MRTSESSRTGDTLSVSLSSIRDLHFSPATLSCLSYHLITHTQYSTVQYTVHSTQYTVHSTQYMTTEGHYVHFMF